MLMPEIDIRTQLLEIIAEKDKHYRANPTGSNLQTNSVFTEIKERIKGWRSIETEQAILTCWYDLFRNGILAWGHTLGNPNPPFFHVTSHGRTLLENLSRDPSNPEGYIKFLEENTNINLIAKSYINEAVSTYNTNNFKAAAVMVGAASESLVLAVCKEITSKLEALDIKVPRDLRDWRIKKILNGLEHFLRQKKKFAPSELYESFEAYWPSFTHQIRTVRNESGHPTSIAPVTQQNVQASLLIFPELGMLSDRLILWIKNDIDGTNCI